MSARMRIFGLVATCLLAASASAADSAPGEAKPASPKVAYTNKTSVTIPIRISDGDRAKIKAVKFFVKPPRGTWMLYESSGPQVEKFTFQAPTDGEYWFAFPTVDESRTTDVKPEQLVPSIVVVVDTQPPEITVKPIVAASGQTYIQCMMRDDNPDTASLTAEYEVVDGTWRPMSPMGKDMPGVFRPAEGKPPAKIRVIGQDKAGNSTTQLVALATPQNAPGATTTTAANAVLRSENASVTHLPAPVAPPPAVEKPALVMNNAEQRVTEKPPVPATEQLAPAASGSRQTINSNHCTLNYALDNLGAQAIQKVEAYATKDNGKTWQKLAADTSKANAIDLTFSEDGLYGVALVVTTAAQPGTQPTEADQPDWWIEVDTAAPEVKLESATPGTNDDAGLLMLSWSVKDKNLAPDSVELSWSTSHDGPWRSIAKGLRGDSQYRWTVPREAGAKCFLKIEATDRAGNVGRFVSPQSIATELPKPKARVLGINPAAVRQ